MATRGAKHCIGKMRYTSERQAKRAKRGHTFRLTTYCCHYCGGWHNGNDDGSEPRDKWRARDRRERITGMRLREAEDIEA